MKNIFIIILLVPILILVYFFFKAENKQIPLATEVLMNKDNLPAMATGNCNSDSDCFPSGCSSQVCSNHEVITTCEVVEIPEKETYSCGCLDKRCVWFREKR